MSEKQYIGQFVIHPAAQHFREMGERDLLRLADDIKRQGVLKPIVLYQGAVVDGRNRIRGATICGIPFSKIPTISLPDHADPFAFAYASNCHRKDYTEAEKAEVYKTIQEESKRLQAMREEAKESKRAAVVRRHEKAKEDGSEPSDRHVAVTTNGPPIEEKPDRRKGTVAAKLAAEAGVSQRTMERVLSKARKTGGRRKRSAAVGETWRVPQDPKLLAIFLRERWPSDKIKKLAELLLNHAVEQAA